MIFLTEQWMLVSLLILLIYVYFWREGQKAGATLSIHQMTTLVNKGDAVLVDIRDAADYKAGHIVDAINIPHNKLEKQLDELGKYAGKTLVLVDKLGQHTGHAGRLLRAKGLEVARLSGGMAEWQGQNLPLVKK
ncbi:rhodanese-like domain-containing protein [Simiduia sp. 21SJ11W-1]|uniref:rhodanese-like domain-containing protein n=1 Tax=Simiduia sp. 21SJ11W-1 TaxID=2909669 RepID=UPI0020A1E93D|nr:rhodanese-like domain-containing protein [Simiduia sp. 21SJ11W-1]UTA49614.1 rhodanese-like domain-containing protein [Simiduia sp. 21SJ11W-1]